MNPSFYTEISKEIIRIHSTQVTNFLKRNGLGVFYAAVAISSFLYSINVFLYKFSTYTIRDLMYYEILPPAIGMISIFGAICLLFIEDSKKFLNKNLQNEREEPGVQNLQLFFILISKKKLTVQTHFIFVFR